MTGFRTAQRRKAHLRLGIAGPSGSGKTASALLLAYGLCGDWRKIGLIDTENGSGELYVGATIGCTRIGDYQVLTLTAPYEPGKYIQAIREAEQAGLEVVIVDSLSHAWAGEGGLLDQHGKIADRGGNSFAAWRQVTPMHNQLVEAMLQSGIHVIATLRSKTEYVVAADEKGKSTPKKIGLAPVQREGMEYEFTVFLDLDQKHVAYASKDRTNLLDGRYFTPTVETGQTLRTWLEQGTEGNVEPQVAETAAPDAPVSSEQIAALVKLAKEQGLANRTVSTIIHDRYGKHSSLSLTSGEAEDLREHLLTLHAKEVS
jgi:hypothetical protein